MPSHPRKSFTKTLLLVALLGVGCDLLGGTADKKEKATKADDDDKSESKSDKKSKKKKNDDKDDDGDDKKDKKSKKKSDDDGDDKSDKKKPDEPAKKKGIEPIEVTSGTGIQLLAAQGDKVWWSSPKGIHTLQLPDTALSVVPLDEPVRVVAGPSGMAWVALEPACKTGGTCKWAVFGQAAIGDTPKKFVTMDMDSIKGLYVSSGDVFVLSTGPVGSAQASDGTIVSFQIASGKRTLVAQKRATLGWCAADATHLFFFEYTDKGGFVRRVPRGGGPVETVLANMMGSPLVTDTALYTFTDDGNVKVAKSGGKADVIPGTKDHNLFALDADNTLLVTREQTIMRMKGGTPETIVVSPKGVWHGAVAGKTLVWESADKSPADMNGKVAILRVALP